MKKLGIHVLDFTREYLHNGTRDVFIANDDWTEVYQVLFGGGTVLGGGADPKACPQPAEYCTKFCTALGVKQSELAARATTAPAVVISGADPRVSYSVLAAPPEQPAPAALDELLITHDAVGGRRPPPRHPFATLSLVSRRLAAASHSLVDASNSNAAFASGRFLIPLDQGASNSCLGVRKLDSSQTVFNIKG